MDPGRLRNLTFLMSLGGLWAGCFSDEGLPAGTPGGTTGGTTGDGATSEPAGTTTGEDTTGASTTTGGDLLTSTTTTTTGEPLTSTATTDLTSDGGTTTGATGPGPEGQVCVQYGAKYGECYPRSMRFVDEIVAYCSGQVAMGTAQDGPACGEALEDWYACITNLDCRQIEQEFNNPQLCLGQAATIDQLCPGFDP
ncbi:hypothetical protein [Nannocystis pusilla]|uniref:Lipoprotein n=1 Tax=Nannocystis pusilla TaxID=889268 RepID=A0ABS7TKT7_9BACT|nr:hypothetical protein [Nannocystis pusilla]MBZ5708752.1 hypothetical protein [Nannocystis pusilla]